MDYTLLYEKTIPFMDVYNLLKPLALFLLGFGMVYFIFKSGISSSNRSKLFLFFGTILILMMTLIFGVIISHFPQWVKERKILKEITETKNFYIVEGIIENCLHYKSGSEYSESFSVKGLQFYFQGVKKPFESVFCNANKPFMNNQFVRITYIKVGEKNEILKIELKNIEKNAL